MSQTRDSLLRRMEALQPALLRWIRRQTRQEADAQDVLQSTWIEAARDIGQLRDPAKLQAWLRGIARHQIRRRYRDKHVKHWQEIAAAGERSGPARAEAFDEFNTLMHRLEYANMHPESRTALAMHFAFDLTPQEIANATGMKRNTVYRQMREARLRLRARPPAEIRRPPSCEAVCAVLHHLWYAAMYPVQGSEAINRGLLEQTHAFTRLLHAQYPAEPQPLYMLLMQCCNLARFEDLLTHDMLQTGDLWSDRREHWERRWIVEAKQFADRLRTLPDLPEHLRVSLEYWRLYYLPASFRDLDWPRLLDICRKLVALQPVSTWHFSVAQALVHTEGAPAAARYLEAHLRNSSLENNPLTYRLLAKIHYTARRWDRARHYFKMTLRWPHQPLHRARLQEWLRRTTALMRESKPAKKWRKP